MIDMWYFVEKNGRAVRKEKNLLAVQLHFIAMLEQGERSEELEITDATGRHYEKFDNYDPNWNKDC